MYLLRTRFKKEIVAEFLPPTAIASASRAHKNARRQSNKVIILCGGAPGYPSRKDTVEFLAARGYWVFVPRYRGSWESAGSFLKISPDRDVLDIIDQLPKGFRDLWDGKRYAIKNPKVYLIGSSFGGPAVILASRDPRVKKVVALSPVTDWTIETKSEPIDKLRRFIADAFGNGYRFSASNWNKLKNGKFYNPIAHTASIDGSKLLIIHARDDKIVYAKTSVTFAKQVSARLIVLPHGGHLSISNILAPEILPSIRNFLK
jgi:pimeloyl-ACP methyl ester carboxylesterase